MNISVPSIVHLRNDDAGSGDQIAKSSIPQVLLLLPIDTHFAPWYPMHTHGGLRRMGGTPARPAGAPLGPRTGASVWGISGMFLSTYVNKVDRKGRVSVPATFRAFLAGQRFAGIVAIPSFKYPALDASGMDRIEQMSDRIDALDQYSEEQEELSSLLADAQELPFDTEGRIVLPQHLAAHAGISESAAFVGLGRTFQIWEPARYREHHRTQLERARSRGATLPSLGPAGQPRR